jgi:tetratricopeptide (TPR) repeat protein
LVTDRVRRWLRVLWPVALLVLFAASFRRTASDARELDTGADCETRLPGEIAELERCLAVAPDDVEMMVALGKSYAAASRWRDAEDLYKRALAVDPRDGDAHLYLAELLLKLGDPQRARAEADAALLAQPGNTAVLNLIERAAAEKDAR